MSTAASQNVEKTAKRSRKAAGIPIKNIVEAALLSAGKPLDIDRLLELFDDTERPTKQHLRTILDEISLDCDDKGFELVKVASGYRFQVKQAFSPWVSKLWEERPQRYSRALLETLALIAYRQPITRGDIEDIRGVAVSSNIIKTLLERSWVRVVGHKDVPGKPALYGTTKHFLDYFNLQGLDQLPQLSEIRDLEAISFEIEQLNHSEDEPVSDSEIENNFEIDSDSEATVAPDSIELSDSDDSLVH
ncbi:SMC-Scp complex subunit ScpB [Alkalimarinus sediminis]|uniref:SMC-Scp complex subunit ScpB n=1 Tax=Alkalimarinus sediminis TaxID=1632866 RepID=A0A9E8HKQ6_9ALTE|nr:SMC-Scp complex subunit ScpB [Alkalimarinus sediminis]UZW75932.1 SMC-Scp complex subunit ScpB [Alkalimarinus sediminis]